MGNKENSSYEMGVVVLLALLWGIVILNRLAIVYLSPFIIDEFRISYAQAGALTSILALTFAFSTWFFGGLSDRVGRKIVLIPATIFFSIMSWCSGLSNGFVQMAFVRGLMGIGQGGILPASVATIAAESNPNRRGFNFGLHQALAPLIAVGLGAILVTQLTRIMSWRMVFFMVGVPGLIITMILYFYIREPRPLLFEQGGKRSETATEKLGFFAPLKCKNVVLSCIVNSLMMCCMFVFAAFGIVYLSEELYLSVSRAGIIMSLLGVTGFAGCILLPLLSDYIGRKKVIIPSLFVTGLCFLGFISCGSNYFLLALFIAIAGFGVGGIGPITIAALTTESIEPSLAATASGIPVSFGEIFGGALMPLVAGYFADIYGLKVALYFSALAPLIGGVVALCYEETAPRILNRKLALGINKY